MAGHGPGGHGARYLTDEEKQGAPKITRALVLRVLSYLKPYWKQLILALACIGASAWLGIMPAILTGHIIDDGLIAGDLQSLIFYIILSLIVLAASGFIGVASDYLNSWIAQHITFDMRNQMFRHLLSLPQSFFTDNNQGDIITRMTSDIDGVRSTISNTFSSILSNIITLVIAMVAMFQKNWLLAIIGIVIVPLFAIPTRRAGKTRWSLTQKSQECNDKINGILNETLSVSGQNLVKLFTKEKYEYERYKALNKEMTDLNIREQMAGRWFRVVLSLFSNIGPMVIYFVGGLLMIRYNSDLTVGDITVLVALLARMYGPMNQLFNIQVDWIRSLAMFSRIFEYFDMPVTIKNIKKPLVPSSAQGRVEFTHVYFAYNEEKMILKDVNFKLGNGECIAVVGPSGAGKSTIINLIPRLYDVTDGEVRFDGVDVRKLDLEFLRSSVGIVTQDTYLFNDTIRANLLYANPDASEEEMIEACKKANIYDFIQSCEQGLDSVVGNRGLKLSGGEKQRISIARVLLKDPALLIFDEATSSLDSISEKAIQDAIGPLIAERTSILIAHRLSTILAADEIIVIKDGQIVERGTHKDLVGAGGVYEELYTTQFQKETENREENDPDGS